MKNLTFKSAMWKGSRPTVNRQSTDCQSQRHCKQTPLSKRWKVLMTLVFLFTFAIGNVWGQTTWVKLDSIDFTNTTGFPAQTITGDKSAVKTATINGVFFRAKAKKSIKINNTTAGVDFNGQNGDASSHHFGIPVTGVNGSIKVIIYHDYNSTSANFKMGISHATDNDPSGTQTWDLSVGNSGATKNANDWVMTKSGLTGSEYIVWAMEAGSSYTVIKKIAIYTEAPSCDATAPGNISKGALSAGVLTLNAAGTPAAKNVWYWQTSATGTSKDNSGTSFNVNAAGTYYVRSLYDNSCWSDAKSFTVTATDLVANYTVVYKDGTTELDNEVIAVGSHPEGIADPKKDCYTFAGWMNGTTPVADVTAISGSKDEVITLTASWTPNYASGAYVFQGTPVTTSKTAATIFNGALYFSAMDATLDTGDASYYGWKIKTNNATVKFLVQYASEVKITLKEKSALNVTFTPLEGAETTETASKSATKTILVKAGTMVTLTTTTDATTTLNRIEIAPLYNATYSDEMDLVDGEDNNVTEVTLPTPSPTTKEGKNFTGWKANQIVTVDDVAVAANTLIAAGKTAVLGANTTFTAQWVTPSDFDVKFFQGYGDPDVQIGDKQTISTGNYATAPADPERAGFAFLGWSYDATAEHIVTVSEYPITAETNFTAMWKQVWTVTFNGAGAVNVEDGKKVASPDSPVQAGKVFQGWYNGESKYDFSAAVTDNLALISKWATADANHYTYAYDDAFHFDGVVYKTPDGKTKDPEAAEASNVALTNTAYTLFSGAEGITSIVANKAIYDYKKGDANKHVTAYLKLAKDDATSNVTFIIKAGYTAVLKMRMNGYSKTPTISLKKGEDAVTPSGTQEGTAEGKNYGELTYNLAAGTYTLTSASQTLYISHIDLETTALPTYTVTYSAGEGSVKEGQSIPTQEAVEAGTVITLASGDALEKSGYVFNGWLCNIDSEVKNPSAEYTMTAAPTTFTAQWLEDNGMAKLYRSDDTPDAGNPYTTLVAAVAAAQDGDKIVLQRSVLDGAGIILTKTDAKTLTIDFGGYTYTAVSPGVGSAGTQNQAFHFEKNNTVTLKNGTITSSGSEIKMLIQNYCDLTLENIILDGSNLEGSHRYVLSNNCGDVVIGSGTEITAKTGDVAFDVCATNYYPEGVTVTVQDGATISGIVEYDVWGTKPANNQATLAIEGGEFDITWNVESALAEDAKENLNVSAGSFSEEVPVEYCADGYIPAPQDPITNKYTVKEGWKVTFVDGEDVEIVPVDKNTPVAEKAMSDKIGYTFDGWFNGVDLYDFAANVTADLTLNAQWAAFAGCADLWPATSGDALIVGAMVDLQAGSVGGSIKVANLGDEGSIAYNANGLSFSNGGNDSVLVTLNNDLKNGSVIKVRLMANGGTKNNGRGLNLLNTARVKKALLGWQANEEVTSGDVREFTYTVVESDGFAGTNVFTLQRQNSVFLQSIKVEECGDAIIYHDLTSEVNIAGKGTVTLGASSVREGYTTTATYSDIDPLYEFVSWEVSGTGASIEDASANPATITMGTTDAVVTLNLQLIPVKFTVEYYDGTTLMGSEQVAVNENPTASEIVTAKRHYTFQGWAETDGGDVVALNTITRTEAGTVKLYAKYEAVACPTEGTVFSMEFDNTKTPTETVVAPKNGGVVELANYATISGGDARIINNNSSNKDAISTSGQFLLKATDEVMKIELECAIATGDVIRIPDNSAKAVLSTSDAKTGTYATLADKNTHEFEATADWNGVDDLYVLYDGSSLNFTKVYVLRPYTISFDLQGHGDAIDAQKLVEGKKVTAPTAPTADGWDFKGWYKEAACTNAWDFDNDVVDGTMSLFAKWTEHVTNDATLKSLKYGSTAITLVDGTYEYNVELAAAVASVPALSAETNAALATKVITNAETFVAGQATSTVVVTAEDGTTKLTYTVNFAKAAAVELQDVTGSITWNFANAVTGTVNITGTPQVLANYAGVTNDNTFESDKLEARGEKFTAGSNANLRANYIRFHTTVPGKLSISYSNTGSSNPTRYIYVNGVKYDEEGSASTTKKGLDTKVFVPAGYVELVMKDGEDVSKNVQIYQMIFNATPDYTRPVSNNIGTLCVDHNVPAGQYFGATFYQIAGRNATYPDKIDFDEVAPNEVLKAGEPYIFQSTTGRIDLFYAEGDAVTDSVVVHGMHGVLVGGNLEITEANMMDVYYISENKLRDCSNLLISGLTLVANRAYIVMSEVDAAPSQPAPGRRRMTIGGGNAPAITTGIDALNAGEAPVKVLINGQIFILRGEKMYDATGRLVK